MFRKIKYSFFLILILLVNSPYSKLFSKYNPGDFTHKQEIIFQGEFSNKIGSYILDSKIFEYLNDDFTNIRLIDFNNNEIPFVLNKVSELDTTFFDTAVNMKLLDFKFSENNKGIYLYEKVDSIKTISSFKIHTFLKNFEKNISVFGSNDKSKWYSIDSPKIIYDYSKVFNFRNTKVELSESNYRFYKLEISNILDKKQSSNQQLLELLDENQKIVLMKMFNEQTLNFKIDSIDFFNKSKTTRKKSLLLAKNKITFEKIKDSQVSDKNTDVYEITTAKEPIASIDINLNGNNFLREIQIQKLSNNKWVKIKSNTLFDINLDGINKKNNTVDFYNSLRESKLRVMIDNKNNPSLAIDSIVVNSEQYEIKFFNKNNKELFLIFGGDEKSKSEYDIEQILQMAPLQETDTWIRNSEILEYSASIKKTISTKLILYISITVMILLLGYLIINFMRNVNQ